MNTNFSSYLSSMLISFIIKTYNEEKKIAACIESVLAAAAELQNPIEIIIADSVSTDRTVQIAARYPVKIVQLKNIHERGCGTGVQLGYQHARGDLIYILDGDMRLLPGYLPAGLQELDRNPWLGGVAGLVLEAEVRNIFDEERNTANWAIATRTERWLNGGGLYRRKAITSAGGYAANRNLKGWEEAELGMRLRAAGWSLLRIPIASTVHDGHSVASWELLARHWHSGRLMANGVLLREAVGKPWFSDTVCMLFRPICIAFAWIVLIILFISVDSAMSWVVLTGAGVLAGVLLGVLSLYKMSVKKAMISVLLWHVHAAALFKGIFLQSSSVRSPIRSEVVVNQSDRIRKGTTS